MVGDRLAHNDACTLGYAPRPCFLRRSVRSGCIPFFGRIVALPVGKVTRFPFFFLPRHHLSYCRGRAQCRRAACWALSAACSHLGIIMNAGCRVHCAVCSRLVAVMATTYNSRRCEIQTVTRAGGTPPPLRGLVMGHFLQAPFTLHARHQVSLSLFFNHNI